MFCTNPPSLAILSDKYCSYVCGHYFRDKFDFILMFIVLMVSLTLHREGIASSFLLLLSGDVQLTLAQLGILDTVCLLALQF